MVFAHGVEGRTSEETIDTLEYLAREYVQDLVMIIDEMTDYKGGVVDDEVVLLSLRKDLPKFKRAKEMIKSYNSVEKGSVFSLNMK